MTSTSPSIGFPFVLIMLLAAAYDVRVRRIPNALTVAGMMVAPILWGLVEGPSTALLSISGGGLALVVAAPLFALGALGGGDAKLLMAAGTFLGPVRLLGAFVAIGVLGGILAVLTAIREGRFLRTLAGTWQLSLHLTTLGHKGTARAIGSPGALTFPYGVAISGGALMAWFLFSAGALVP